MKRPLALIGITYLLSLTFLNLIPNTFASYLVYVFTMLLFISLIFKKLRINFILPICLATCLTATIIQIIHVSNVNGIQKLADQEHVVSGKIYDIPYKQNEHYEYIIKLESVDKSEVKPFLVNLKVDSPLDADIYSKFTGKITFERVFPSSKMYYSSKNIFILGSINKNKGYKVEDSPDKDWYYYVLKLRQKIISTPKEFLKPDIANVINAIIIGERNNLSENVKKDFQKIGVYHLLATSGMHVAIISQFIFYIFKKLKIKEKYAALLSSFVMLLFMSIVGFTPSITRACIMAIIYFLGICISRNSDSLNSLGIAVLIICAANPSAVCDIGLWLSFLATLGIILCYSSIKEYICKKINIKKDIFLDYVISTFSVTLCAFIFTLPIAVLKFQKISLISPVSNLIFIPGINIILNLSIILNALKIAGTPNIILEPLAIICGHITNALLKASELLASIPYASISIKYQEAYVWLIITMVIIALTIMIRPTKKAFIIDALLSINIAFICVISHQIFNFNKLNISFIPCENGICAILSKNNRLAIVSCVSESSEIENISDAISDSYIKNIDYLDLYAEKNIDANKKELENLIYNHPTSNITINSDSPIKIKATDYRKITYYKSTSKTTFWKDITITNLKIGNHTYIKIDTPTLNILLFPNGGDAEKLPESWKECGILVANGLPINYSRINFQKAIISSKSRDSSINISKLKKHRKNAISLYNQSEVHIKINPDGNYKLRRLA